MRVWMDASVVAFVAWVVDYFLYYVLKMCEVNVSGCFSAQFL